MTLLLYIPPFIGLEAISMKMAAGMTMVQSLAGAFSGLMVHEKQLYPAAGYLHVLQVKTLRNH